MKTGEFLNIETIGTKASGLDAKSVNDCLNCDKPKCDGCLTDKRTKDHEYYLRRKERTEALGGCVYCGGKTISVRCKTIRDGIVLRQKQCKVCGKMFYSSEMPVEYEKYLQILKDHK